MAFRIILTIFLVISVVAFPVFFTIGIGVFCVIWFKNYYEIIPIAFIGDVLYGTVTPHFFYFRYVMTLSAFLLVLASSFLRKQLFDTGFQKI
ncbi:MAG: hypothetical protein KA052_00095 [Candidatus Pacebacteria bacterium]|nr:hypothetical protein [Candidatus Paceibacterota bacterium]